MSLSATRTVGIVAAFGTIFSTMAAQAHASVPEDGDLNKTYYGDFDGDGKQDTARVKDFGDYKGVQSCGVEFTLHTGDKKLIKYQYGDFTGARNELRCFEASTVQIVDLNGDGKQELAHWWSVDGMRMPGDTMAVVSLDGKRDTTEIIGTDPDKRLRFVELNGDKRSDLIRTDWVANSGEVSWSPKRIHWTLTGPDGEPAVGKVYETRGSGMTAADFDPTTPGDELLIPWGETKSVDGKNVQTRCELQVVRGGTNITAYPLKGIVHCNPADSVALDTDNDGRIDTLEVTWHDDTYFGIPEYKTRHRFNERGEFGERAVVSPNPPVAESDYVKMSFQWGLEGRIPVLRNDKNIGGGRMTIETPPSHGDVSIDGDRIVYTRTHMKPGWDSLVYKVTTSDGQSTTAKLRIEMVGNPPSKDPNVRNVAKNDRVRMYPGSFEVADINVLRNDKVYGVVKVSVDTPPKIGTAVALDNGRIRYDRRGKGYGTDRFTYTVTDPKGRETTAVVLVETPRRS